MKNSGQASDVNDKSILDLTETQAGQKYFFHYILFFKGLSSEKLLEKDDRKELALFTQKFAKLTGMSLICGAIVNRMLTKIKFRQFDFLNIQPLFRIPMRLLIFAGFVVHMSLIPMMTYMQTMTGRLNEKYYFRFKHFLVEKNPLIMNPSMYNDPELNEEEREALRNYYSKMRMEAELQKLEEKHRMF